MHHRRLLLAWIVAMALAQGCHSKQKADQAAAERNAEIEARAHEIAAKMATEIEGHLRVDEAERRQAERAALREHFLRAPQDLFEVSGLEIVANGPRQARGRPGQLRTITTLTVTNKATLPARDIVVRVDFFDDDARRVASIPVRLRGALPAGGTRTFSADDGTLDSAAVETPARKTSATVVETAIDEPPSAMSPTM